MSILLNPWGKADEWMQTLSALLPDEEFLRWPDCPEPPEVEMVVAWRMKRSDLASFVQLKAILSMGAGTEQWQREGSPDVPIVRLADPAMSDEMAAYALHWVLHFQRDFDASFGSEDVPSWGTMSGAAPAPGEYPVGILGYGTIGRRIGRAFAELGHPINAWSRGGTDEDGVSSFRGVEELAGFLGASRAVVNVLPNTEATAGLLTAERFGQFYPGATFVNIGRGTVVADESELVRAVDAGSLGAAVLDVTNPEPPSPQSPLLGHPRIRVTPHVAGSTQVASAARLIAANITRIRNGDDPFPVVDPKTGY